MPGISRFRRGRLAVLFILLCLAGVAPARAQPAEAPADCGAPLLRIEHEHAVDLAHACEAWRRVARFLMGQHGMRVATPVTLAFVERVEIDLGSEKLRVLGFNDRAARTIRVTSMTAAWLRDPERLMFRQPVDEELHISLIVHELAHALLKDNYRIPVPSLVCDEYVAYVTQFATMAPATRARVLAGYPAQDFDSLDEITEVCLMMTPHEFGVRAWRHYERVGQREGMVEAILSGRFRVESFPW
ncbi:DUF6639 family protein [Falsiroseomonas sp.]|uniref:DUF6639 family protein n=1 Tax=Falsiroseomonas sp. TaxID=2870721 RepID=UPI003561C20A